MKKHVYLLILVVLLFGMGGCAMGAVPIEQDAPAAEPVATEAPVQEEAAPVEAAKPEIRTEDEAMEGESDVLRIGLVVSGRPPRAFYPDADPTQPVSGYEPDILEEISRRTGLEIVYYDVAWSSLFTGLLANKWDVGASDVFIKPEREEMMDFSEPHLDADLGVLVPIDSDIESFEDLKGKVLCTDTGAGSESWLRENLEKWGPYEIQTYDGVSDAFLDVQAGRCDGAVTDDRGVDWYVKDFSDSLKKAMVLGEAYNVGFAFRPGDPLIDTFNEAIRSMKKDGFIAESYKTYYGVYPPEGSSAFTLYETPAPEGAAPAGEKPQILTEDKAMEGGSDVLRIGLVVSGRPPRAFYPDADPTKPVSGYEPDILEEISRRTGLEIVYYDVAWSSLFTGLLANKWDVGASDVFIKIEREEMMDFSEPHLDADLGVLVPIDSEIASFEDLKGKVLCTDTGAGSESWLRENLEKWGPYEIQTYDGVSDAFLDVQAGRCDGAVTDDRGVDWYVKDFSDTLKKAMVLGEAYRVGFAFRPDDPLIDTFNEAIRSMKEDGFIAESYKTYYGVYPPEGSSAFTIYETPYVPTK